MMPLNSKPLSFQSCKEVSVYFLSRPTLAGNRSGTGGFGGMAGDRAAELPSCHQPTAAAIWTLHHHCCGMHYCPDCVHRHGGSLLWQQAEPVPVGPCECSHTLHTLTCHTHLTPSHFPFLPLTLTYTPSHIPHMHTLHNSTLVSFYWHL